jgi:putative ABC transport system substrate-binding protein
MIQWRSFITLLSGAAAWPLAARAQQRERMRRIGMLMPLDENDPVEKTYLSAFTQALAGLGWTDGRNMRMDLRSHRGDINRIRALAQELVGLQPDIILPTSTPATVAVQRETHTIPIVFASVADPVASGIVERLDWRDRAPGVSHDPRPRRTVWLDGEAPPGRLRSRPHRRLHPPIAQRRPRIVAVT